MNCSQALPPANYNGGVGGGGELPTQIITYGWMALRA